MRKCVDCGKDISYRGNRAIRCEECQKRYRQFMMSRIGSARSNPDLYRLYKLYLTLTCDELRALFAITKKAFHGYKTYEEYRFLRTKLKLIDRAYKEVCNGRNSPSA